MSDWRQIQARIRKARTSADPPGQLSALYERTRDAMVAFELAQIHEKAGTLPEAIRWYTTAAERFRRAQWKQKAEEGLARLGAQVPAPAEDTPAPVVSETAERQDTPLAPIISEFPEEQANQALVETSNGEQESVFEQPSSERAAPVLAAEAASEHRRRRRGRRGGRGRHKAPRAAAQVVPAAVATNVPPSMFDRIAEARPLAASPPAASAELAEPRVREPESARAHESLAAPPAFAGRGRSGDPALSSRMAQLESQLRRLLACAIHPLDEPDEAPAGPGVFLITDTDLTSYYYVESCQTLRVGVGNLLRSGRASRESSSFKGKLAEHLGISEAKVGRYLAEHCGVRWLQLDEGAALLAHFAVAVLRPIANE